MASFARSLGEDQTLWEVVGLCHDLDYFDVQGDWTKHGILTAQRLRDRLPEEATAAIAAHDHRTGQTSDTTMADMLKLADSISVMGFKIGRGTLNRESPPRLREMLGDRTYLMDIVERMTSRHHLSIRSLPIPTTQRDGQAS